MYCMRLAGNTARKISPKNRHAHHRTTLSGYVFATKAHIDNRKKTCDTAISPPCTRPHNMVNFGPLRSTGEFGAPQQISTSFAFSLRYCSDVAQRRSTKLCTMFGRLLGWYTIYTFWRRLAPDGIFPGAKFTLSPSLALSYIGSVTGRHSSRAKLCDLPNADRFLGRIAVLRM